MKRIKFQLSDWLMILAAVIWGLNFSFIKISLKEIPPLPFNGIRLLLSSLVLMTWFLKVEGNFKVKKEHLPKIIFLAISGYTIYQYIFISGINLTTASNTGVIFGLSPIMISLLSSFFKHEKIEPIGWVGILLGFVGVYIIISGKSGGFSLSSQTLKGDLVILLAVLLWANYSVAAKPLLKVYSPLKLTTLAMTIGSLLFFPFSIAQLKTLPISEISFTAWFCLAFSGIMALSVGLIIWFFSVKRVGNSQTAVYANLPVVFAVIFAWMILSEKIHLSLIIGALIILLGIFFTHRGREGNGQPTKTGGVDLNRRAQR
jgi:drug/metabolite transporter (DMT)-like permease